MSHHVALVGPTAAGKSAVAMAMCAADDRFEIVTVDSMQVYRGMDVGTAKPSLADRSAVAHHLIDVADPWDDYDLATYQRSAAIVIEDLERRGRRALLVGGTGLYLRAVVDSLDLPGQFPEVRVDLESEPDTAALHGRLADLDPMAASRMEPGNRRRIVRALEVTIGSGRPFSSFGPGLSTHGTTSFIQVGLRRDRDDLDERIVDRYRIQMDAGFLDEVSRIARDPRGWSRSASQALGYKELAGHLAGEISLDDALDMAITRTRRFARRQERWFRRDPRLQWIDLVGTANVEHVAEQVLRLAPGPAE